MIQAKRFTTLTRCLGYAAALLIVASARANGYPDKPIRLIVGFVAGGPVDITARAVGVRLSESLRQPVVIDNRGGASGLLASELVAKATPDGHTLLMCSASNAITAAVSSGPGRNFLRDFAPITKVAIITSILVVNPKLPANTVKDLIALALAQPGKLKYASTGVGSSAHLAGELFKSAAGVDIAHIPYKGGGPAAVDLISGQVQLTFISAPATLPHIKSGRLRALAVTNAKRSTLLPELPTLSESGLRGYEFEGWHGLCAPATTPRVIVNQLNGEVAKIVRRPDVIAHLAEGGAEAIATTPDVFAAQLRAEIDKWTKLVKSAGIRME